MLNVKSCLAHWGQIICETVFEASLILSCIHFKGIRLRYSGFFVAVVGGLGCRVGLGGGTLFYSQGFYSHVRVLENHID